MNYILIGLLIVVAVSIIIFAIEIRKAQPYESPGYNEYKLMIQDYIVNESKGIGLDLGVEVAEQRACLADLSDIYDEVCKELKAGFAENYLKVKKQRLFEEIEEYANK